MNAGDADKFDPLLGCLGILCRLENLPFSEQAAIAGLPLGKQGLTPSLFVRAAKQMRFAAHINKRSLSKISNLVLPAVLIFHDNNACVLTRVNDDDTAEVVFPENPEEARTITWEELVDNYAGYIIYLTPSHEYEKRAEQIFASPHGSWFWGTIFRYKSIFLHVFIAAFLSNMFVLVIPIYIMNVYDRVIPTNAIQTLWVLTIGAIIFFFFDFMARTLRGYLIDIAGRRADIILARELFQQVLNLRMRQKPTSAGAFASYFNEFEVLREFFTSATLATIIDFPFILLFVFAIWLIGGPIVVIPLIAIPIVIVLSFLFELPTRASVKKALTGITQKNAILVESINGLETIKAIGAEGIMQQHWEDSVTNQTRALLKSRILTNVSLNLTIWSQQLVLVGIIAYGVFLVHAHVLTIGGLIACTILAGRVMMLGQIVGLATRFARSREALKALNKIMSLPNERDPEHKYIHKAFIQGNIAYENVNFIYPRRRIPALENISLKIKPGEKIGIIGKMGAGKSTLLKLLVALYIPSSGTILVDETDNTEIDPADLRHNIRYISSDSTLFYGTIKENIMMGNYSADDEDLLSAAKMAGVDHFVQQSPLGYDMPVGENGEALSSGQRAAIVLARSLVSEPSVLILDDPTATTDNYFENEFIHNIGKYIEEKTLLLATHRSSMLKLVDRLIVLDRGKIVADGPKDEVLAALKSMQEDNNPEKKENT